MALPALVLFIVILWILVSAGERLGRAAGLAGAPPAETFGLSLAGGLAVLQWALFVLALLRGVGALAVAALLVAAAALSRRELRANLTRLRDLLRLRPSRPLHAALGAGTAAVALLGLLISLSPPTSLDTLAAHFVAPRRMLQDGGLLMSKETILHRLGGYYFVYLAGFALQGELLARLLNFAAFLGCLALGHAAAERLRPGAGLLGAFLMASSPVVGGYAGYEYLEMPVLMNVLAAMVLLQRDAFAPALAFCGMALSLKNSAFPVVVPALWIAWRAIRARAFGAMIGGSLAALAAALAWPLWNKGSTGSFFPYYETGLGGAAATVGGSAPGAALEILRSAILGSVSWTDFAGPFVFAGLAGSLIFRGSVPGAPRFAAALLASLALYLLVLLVAARGFLAHDTHGRYLAPFILALGGPPAAAFARRALEGPSGLRLPVLAALLLPALPLLLLKAGKAAFAVPVVAGIESRSAFLAKRVESFPACKALNDDPRPGLRVLYVGRCPYPLERPFLLFFDWTFSPVPPDAAELRRRGFTHVLVEPDRLPGWEGAFDRPGFREAGLWKVAGDRRLRLFEVEERVP